MHIAERDEHSAKARYSISLSFETASNVTIEREEHDSKHLLESFSTDAGMQIADREKHLEKALSSISRTLETPKNLTLESSEHE
jgi:hypothetical protein